jgi:NitT/TauT family transport system substrate-binding protein
MVDRHLKEARQMIKAHVRMVWLVLVGILGVGLLVGTTQLATAQDMTPVRFMVANPVINLGHTQLAVAQQKGYFADANLSVEYLTSDGTVATVQALASGTADMGQVDTLSIDAALSRGVTDIVAVCSYVANNIYYLAVPADSPIQEVADLKGKKIGLSSLGTGVFYNARVMLEQAGLDWESDVEFVTIQQPAAQLDALVSGTVDALSIIDVSVATFQNQGEELRTFQPAGPIQWQWNVVGVRRAFLEENPEAVAAVCRSILQAEVYVVTNPAAALQQFKDWGGDTGTTPDEQSINIIKFRADQGFRTYPEGDDRWGWINVEAMPELAALYFELGQLESEVDVANAYTTELLDQIQPNVEEAMAEANQDAS